MYQTENTILPKQNLPMSKPYKYLLFALFIFINIKNTCAQGQDDLVTALNQELIPLKMLTAGSGFDDLEKLKPLLKDKQVIGIGEATHGTHEFFVFKHRMLVFLVKEMGVKTFVIEGDFAGTQVLDDYVINGKGEVQNAIAGTGFGIWMTGEFVDMIDWLKDYNAAQPADNKVHVFGCDMQWGTFAVQSLKVYLDKTNQFTPEMAQGFEAFKKYMPALTNTEKSALRTSVKSLSKVEFRRPGYQPVGHVQTCRTPIAAGSGVYGRSIYFFPSQTKRYPR
jgi:erythromycin esterase